MLFWKTVLLVFHFLSRYMWLVPVLSKVLFDKEKRTKAEFALGLGVAWLRTWASKVKLAPVALCANKITLGKEFVRV